MILSRKVVDYCFSEGLFALCKFCIAAAFCRSFGSALSGEVQWVVLEVVVTGDGWMQVL